MKGTSDLKTPACSLIDLLTRLLLLVQLDSRVAFLAILTRTIKRVRLRLPSHSGLEVARFGMGCGERADIKGILPFRQLTCLRGRFNGAFPVSKLGVRAIGQ